MIWTTSKTEKHPDGNYFVLVDGRNVFSSIPDFDSKDEYEKWYKVTKDYWLFLVYMSDKQMCLRAYKQAQQYLNIMKSDIGIENKRRCSYQYEASMLFYNKMLNKVQSYKH